MYDNLLCRKKVKWISVQYSKKKAKDSLKIESECPWMLHELNALSLSGSLKLQNKTYQLTVLTNSQTGMTMALQAIGFLLLSPSFSFFLTSSVSATDGFLWVQKRARLFHCNPQPHRRKSLLEHWLISTKSQTRARERSLGIRPCSNSKGLPNSPGKPLWN